MKEFEYCNMEGTIFGTIQAENIAEAEELIAEKEGIELYDIDLYWSILEI